MNLPKASKKFIVIAAILMSGLLTVQYFYPLQPTSANSQDEINKAQQESERLRRELEVAKSKGNSLSNEISRLNTQARLNELEIQDTQSQIQSTQSHIMQTNSQIEELNKKLDTLSKTMDQTNQAATARIRDSYKKSRTSSFASLLTADSFQGAMRNYEYLKRVEEEDARILGEMVEAKNDYLSQKNNLEKLKFEKENLQVKLQDQYGAVASKQQELQTNKNQQSYLLGLAQNDQSRYSQLLAENEARIASMRAILAGGIASGQRLGYFSKGEVIGYEGATGCVTGSHLHFSIVRGGGFQNPWGFLGKTVNGVSYGYPHANYLNYINPNTGGYAQYGSWHNGLDTARGQGAPLIATADGEAFFHVPYTAAQINASSWCPSWAKPARSPQQEIWLRHADGTISLYAHVSGVVRK